MKLAPRAWDSLLAAGAAAVAGVLLFMAVAGQDPWAQAGTSPVVAHVLSAQGAVQVRAAQTLGWRRLAHGDDVHESDSVFIAPGGAARLAFVDGTELDLDEKSLVVVEALRQDAREVTLKQGSVSGLAGERGLTLVTANGTAELSPRSEARVELDQGQVAIAVRKGEAQVKGKGGQKTKVGQGGRAQADGAQAQVLPAWPVTLVSPAPNARRRAASADPVTLEWKGTTPDGAKVQLARDRLFAFVTLELDALPGHGEVAAPEPGVTWWRVVDGAGRPLSESRRFSALAETAPGLLAPREGEVVLAPEGQPVGFTWTPLVGVHRYRFEVSSSRGFEPIVATEAVAGAGFKWVPRLAEGTWYWRVASLDGELGEGLPSPPQKFRLIRKALPNAPELLNPEVEIGK